MVESQPSKLLVAGSIPVSRSSLRRAGASQARLRLGKPARCEGGLRLAGPKRAAKADVAQLAERVLGKDEVTSSILVIGSTNGQRDTFHHLERAQNSWRKRNLIGPNRT